METLAERDDAVLPCVEGRELHRVLVGFCAAVVEEQRVVGISACLAQPVCELLLERVLHAVGVEAYLCELVAKGRDVPGVAVAHGNYRVAAIEVEVFLTVLIPYLCAPGLDGCYVEK